MTMANCAWCGNSEYSLDLHVAKSGGKVEAICTGCYETCEAALAAVRSQARSRDTFEVGTSASTAGVSEEPKKSPRVASRRLPVSAPSSGGGGAARREPTTPRGVPTSPRTRAPAHVFGSHVNVGAAAGGSYACKGDHTRLGKACSVCGFVVSSATRQPGPRGSGGVSGGKGVGGGRKAGRSPKKIGKPTT